MFFDVSKRKHSISEVREKIIQRPYPKYIVNRNNNWSVAKQEAFIEYIIAGYPIADIIMWRQPSDENRQCHVMHGEKKLNAIMNFYEGRIKCYGQTYDNMQNIQKDIFNNSEMRINVIEVEEEEEGKRAVDLWKRFF